MGICDVMPAPPIAEMPPPMQAMPGMAEPMPDIPDVIPPIPDMLAPIPDVPGTLELMGCPIAMLPPKPPKGVVDCPDGAEGGALAAVPPPRFKS